MALSDADLENALRSLARIIDRYGEAYWPLFDRLETELDARRSRSARLAAYRIQPHLTSLNPSRQHPGGTGERSSKAHHAEKP